MVLREPTFRELIAQVRRGDDRAAELLIRRYEGDLRVIARVRLTDPALRRVVDSMDICQSIMANFFVRAASGQFQLDTQEQLLKLLSTMVRNKVTDVARRARRDRRDARRTESTSADEMAIAGQSESPSQIVSRRELLAAIHEQLSDEERQIAELRGRGMNWTQIAQNVGSTPEAVRKRLSRAVDRVVHQMGFDEVGNE